MTNQGEKVLNATEVDMSNSTVALRLFRTTEFDEKSLTQFREQTESIASLNQSLQERMGSRAPEVVIITNEDLPEAGKDILSASGINLIKVSPNRAARRARLAKALGVSGSDSKGTFSYIDMLNSALAQAEEGQRVFFVSTDLAAKPEELIPELEAMVRVQEALGSQQVSLIGALVEGVHTPELINDVYEGTKNITLQNVSSIFPNNVLASVDESERFSGISDNALAGYAKVDTQEVPIGGNEDFLLALEAMKKGVPSILIISPYIRGKRVGEVKGVDSKMVRRLEVYRLYAQRVLEETNPDNLEQRFEHTIDHGLFFVRVNELGIPEVILTKRQQDKGVQAIL